MNIVCAKCKTENDQSSKFCSNCGIDLKNQKRKGCAVFGFVGIFVLIALFAFLSGSDEETSHTKIDALVMSQYFVERNLKAPSTADFGSSTDNISQLNDSTFIVRNYVDSQNSFGAMIRSNYKCKLYIDKEGTAHLIDLKIE